MNISDMDTLSDVRSLISSALNVVKAGNVKPQLPIATYQPPNKKIKTQRPFFSTKRKRKPATVRIVKPTSAEKIKICQALLSGPGKLTVSPSTYSKSDHSVRVIITYLFI